MKTGSYVKSLSTLVSEFELELGMNVSVDGGSLKGLPLYDFLLVMQKTIKSSDKNNVRSYTGYITKFCMKLSYYNDRFSFQNTSVLDFGPYDNSDVLCSFFLQYQEHRDIKDFKKKDLRTFIKYVQLNEQGVYGLKDSLSYRMIRLFLTLVCMGFHVDASVVCQFLRNQFWIFEGLNPRTKLSSDERTKLMNKVKANRGKYSRRFKENMRSSIRKVSKTATDLKDYRTSDAVDANYDYYGTTDSNPNVEEPIVQDSPNVEPNDVQPIVDVDENVFEQDDSPNDAFFEDDSPNVKSTPKVNYGSRKIVKTDAEVERLKQEQLAEEKRFEDEEKARKEAEEKARQESEEKARIEAEEKARIEEERLAKEKAERLAREKAEREEVERLAKEKAKAERIRRKAFIEEQAREEERRRLAEAEQIRLAEEKRLADELAEKKRLDEEKLQQELAEKKRLEDEARERKIFNEQRDARLKSEREKNEQLESERLIAIEEQRLKDLEKKRLEDFLKAREVERARLKSQENPNKSSTISVEGGNKSKIKSSKVFN